MPARSATPAPPAPPEANPPSFEAAVARVERAVATLNAPDLSLDDALAAFESGVTDLRAASAALERAEAQVLLLTETAAGLFTLTPARVPA